ncbi:MAG: tRNA (adenosine(37)-N6)-threonylcarbamoyltransferase complex dimerization subunit type 1 TsaB [Bacteroidales bacterium]|nr:tRNA (adenosine(37)-N6)-threonylcarbamoyltransferase complex dimerization subunit type 1 TsaB [Bacteroidales bacterium]
MRPRIILLETSTSLCSTALIEGDRITAVRKSETPRAHAAMTAPFVADMLAERGLKVSDCDAVCLSMGPGSYTGLRVGSSTAKGLCFGGGIPLLAVGTLDVLAAQAIAAGLPAGCTHIVPMIDARRMEVYTAVYSASGERLTDVTPRIVDDTFENWLAGDTHLPSGIMFIGDGVSKCEQVLAGEGRWFRQECPTAEAMLQPALEEFRASRFRDTAYFEPFYLKDFVATVGKKLF